MNRKFYRFGYSNPPRDAQPRLHHSRDGAAFNEITDPLYSRGFQYGTFIHNYPHHRQPADAFTFLKARDLVVCTTRPPLDDLRPDPTRKQSDEKDWRRIDRSEDHLEQAIFDDLRPFFQRLSRYTVNLTPEIASHLPPTFERMVRIHFHSKGKGTIASTYVPVGGRDHSHKTSKDDFNSVGFFIHLKQITGYPCGLIASFSMGGYENLLWNRIVRLRFQRWFDHPIFCLALLKLPDEPPQPLTPALADDAPAEVLIEHRLPANRKPAKSAAESDPGYAI